MTGLWRGRINEPRIPLCVGRGGIVHAHLLRKVLAVNVMGSGVFLVLVSLAARSQNTSPDPVPHAMVITGIVVAISATALALSLMLRVSEATGQPSLPDSE